MIKHIDRLIQKARTFFKSEKGQGMVEYALIIAFVAAIAIFALNGSLKTSVKDAFDKAGSAVTSATSNASSIVNDGGGSGPVVSGGDSEG